LVKTDLRDRVQTVGDLEQEELKRVHKMRVGRIRLGRVFGRQPA